MVERLYDSGQTRHEVGTHMSQVRRYRRGMAVVTTPWGKATAIEEVSLPQRAGEKRFATVVELLETEGGERLVRFAYTTGGRARRGPVTLRARELEKLRSSLERTPELRRALGGMRLDE